MIPSFAWAGNPGVTVNGSVTSGNCAKFLNGYTIQDAGLTCGGSAAATLGTSATNASPYRSGDLGTGLFTPTGSTVAVATNGLEQLRIDSSGNVGIGTSTMSNKLDVNGGLALGSYAGANAAGSGNLIASGKIGIGTTAWGTNSVLGVNGGIAVGTYATTALGSIPSNGLAVSGTVGIGTSSLVAGAALDLSNNTTSSNSSIVLPIGTTGTRPTTGVAGMVRYNSTTPAVEAYVGTAWTTIATTGQTFSSGINLGTNATNTNPSRSGDLGTGEFTPSGSTYAVATNGAERLRLDSSGNLGLGTSTMTNRADIYGAVAIGTGYAGANTAPTSGLIVQGNLGIGTATPTAPFQVKPSTATSPLSFGVDSPYTTYGAFSMNGLFGDTTMLGFFGGGGGDVNFFFQTPAFGNIILRPNGNGGGTNAANIVTIGGTQSVFNNGTLSIGTTSSTSKLNVYGNASIGTTYSPNAAPTDGLIIVGNVGIGTITPGDKLDVQGGNILANQNYSTGGGALGAASGGSELKLNGNAYHHFSIRNNAGNLQFGTADSGLGLGLTLTPAMTVIGASGNVGIGLTSPSSKLSIYNNGGASPASYLMSLAAVSNTGANTDSNALIDVYHTNGANSREWKFGIGSKTFFGDPDNFGFYDNYSGSARLVIDTNGRMGIGTTSPASTLSVNGSVAIGSSYAGAPAAPTNGAIIQGNVAIGTATPLTTLDVYGTIKTRGYTIGTLPTGVVGMKAYVTDQLTVCPVAGGGLTSGGSKTCPVFYDGSSWVGD